MASYFGSAPGSNDLLTSFSPSLDFYAVSLGDGRVKIWDTLKGQLQVEFTDLVRESADGMRTEPTNGHLSVDYTCMEWAQRRKKKNRPGNYVLVLGTGGGDVVALDVSGGQLKWKISDCHPGGVTAVSFSGKFSYIFSAGVDGMVCQIDCSDGNLLGKFRVSTKAVSSLSISPDGELLATAAGQLKVFSSSVYKKVQKFSGHPANVRCMTFSEDGNNILSSAVGEKFVTMWKIDHTKNRSACGVLPVEYPIIYLDCKGFDDCNGRSAGLYVLAVSEAGNCYFWHGRNIQDLHHKKPTIISLSAPISVLKNNGIARAIYSAKIQGITESASIVVLVAYGSVVKPHFEKVCVNYGVDVAISWSQHAVLLPRVPPNQKEDQNIRKNVTTIDQANAEDAVIPFPKMHDYQDKKRKNKEQHSLMEHEIDMIDEKILDHKEEEIMEDANICLEDKLKSAGIICNKNETMSEGFYPSASVDAATFKSLCLFVDTNKPKKKTSDYVLSSYCGDAFNFLEVLIIMWKTRSVGEESVLPWISHVIVSYGYSLMPEMSDKKIFEDLHKMTMSKSSAFESLLQLSGRLQLVTAQIDKPTHDLMPSSPTELPVDDVSDEDDEDIDEVLYGEVDTTSSHDEFEES